MCAIERIFVGRRYDVITECGGLTHIYEGRYLLQPDGPACFDAEGFSTKKELKEAVANFREHYPHIEICWV